MFQSLKRFPKNWTPVFCEDMRLSEVLVAKRSLAKIAVFLLVILGALGGETETAAAQVQAPAPAPASALVKAKPEAGKTSTPTPAPTQSFPQEFAQTITTWNDQLGRIEQSLNEPSIGDDAIAAHRATLGELPAKISGFLNDLRPRVDGVRAQVEKLGPTPTQGQLDGAEGLAQQRADLIRSLGDLSAAQGAADAALARTNELTRRMSELRSKLFKEFVLQRTDSPFSLHLWNEVAENADFKTLGITLDDWWRKIDPKSQFFTILAIAASLWAALAVIAARGVRHFRHWDDVEPPSDWQRAVSAAWVILLRALPSAGAGAFLYFSLSAPVPVPPPANKLALAAIMALVIVAAVRVVSRTVLAVHRKEWRLVHLSDEGAVKLYRRLLLIAGLYAADAIITAFNDITRVHVSVSVVQSCVASLVLAYLLISILRIRAQNGDGTESLHPIGPVYVRIPLWLIAFTIIGSVVTGYIALARFVTTQLIVTGTILLVAYLFLLWAAAFGQSLADDGSHVGRALRDHARLAQNHRQTLVLPITLLLRLIIILVAVPLVLLQWGSDARDIAEWFKKALFGFDIGSWHVSITTVIIALGIFVAVVAVSKVIQTWLDGHVLAVAGVDGSVRQSVRTGVGYLGFGVAALLAISYTGLDFSNLAILAGALSVGLGFGLQSIVNNFVSGLILLAERQIKVGDWIVVGSDEGTVRRISVRSTEIETFDRANVIIPNSQLIAQSVKNWTLHNNIGRVGISVGVHYDSDPEEVRDILLTAANLHPHVLATPEPFATFDDFADSTLKFTLFIYLSNVSHFRSAATDLRIAILKEFRARNIEIPYPQTDVNIRDLAWIKRAIIQRMGKQSDNAPMSVHDFEAETGALKPGVSDAPNGKAKKDDDDGEDADNDGDVNNAA
jgi:potassium-dependent mechanosensitive channel